MEEEEADSFPVFLCALDVARLVSVYDLPCVGCFALITTLSGTSPQ